MEKIRTLFYILCIGYFIAQITRVTNPKPKEEARKSEPIKEYPVGYCWERARDINPGDLDSLYEYGGKWHNKNISLEVTTKHYSPPTKSIKQRSKEYNKKREEIGQQPLTQGDAPLNQ